MNYEPIIGLEVHVELSTASKMFCPNSSDYFGQEPNIHTCPVCLGLPGALPYTNKKAIESCVKIGLALNCKVSSNSVFERKNYFYPDLPKGYQISQYRWPLCTGGWFEIESGGRKRRIRINRVHMEEDTAKLIHQFGYQKSKIKNQKLDNETLIDFNRSGVPLVEIVTEPDFQSSSEVADFAKKLQQIFRYLNVSNADMERGDMRIEANVSVRERKMQNARLSARQAKRKTELPNYRVELKNINSFRFAVAAIEYEIERQAKALNKGEKLVQETRGWDEGKKQTYIQRVKEEPDDYRYFPEPDIPPLVIDKNWVEKIKGEMMELPSLRAARFVKEYKVSESQAKILTYARPLADYFEEAVRVGSRHSIEAERIANSLINKKFDRDKILPARFIEYLRKESGKPKVAGEELEAVVKKVIEENSQAVEDYKKGRQNALQFLVGQAMQALVGKADPREVLESLKEKISNQKEEV